MSTGPSLLQRSRQDRCYYGGIEAPESEFDDLDPVDSVLGVGGGGAAGMAAEAVPQADPTVDFSQYDNNGDGDVDFTGIIHSGPDMAATGDPCHTWSHAIDASLGTPGGVATSDGVLVKRVFTMPEIDLEIGVATHEMAHALGEPDYYNPAYVSAGTGDWDIMAGGSWFGNPPGSNPVGFNPASKVFQGWIKPRIIHKSTRNVFLQPREVMPKPNYSVDQVDPNIVLVPTTWAKVGETDQYDHEWTEEDVYGLVKDGNKGYVVEGYYLENFSRTVNADPIHEAMSRSPYFDRQALSSGLMVWHFDYYKRSNVYNGANDAGTDPNRPQMDPVEFDYNDNTQELQLNLTRGEPSDLIQGGTATGITSGTRKIAPDVPTVEGDPQAEIPFSGFLPPATEADHEFVVEENPANYLMEVSVTGTGDCTLELLKDVNGTKTRVAGPADSGFVGETENIYVTQPEAGTYYARVGDFAACSQYEGHIKFESPNTAFLTTGAGDTWSNWSEAPTGWAFTNIRPRAFDELDHRADAPTNGRIRVDILNIGKNDKDASPGFAQSKSTLSAGSANQMTVPIFNNGGKTIKRTKVVVREGSRRKGPVVVKGFVNNLGGYSRTDFEFPYTPSSEGPNDLFVEVDTWDRIKEADEKNNYQKATLWAGPADPSVLIVDDDGSTDSEAIYAGALASLGVPYAIVKNYASADLMSQYQAVIWEAGLERYQGQLNQHDRDAITEYLDGGGSFMFTSPRAAAALGEAPGRTNPGSDESMPLFLRNYFGADYVDTLQVGGGKMTGTGDILGSGAIQTDVFPGRPLQDVFKKGTSGFGTATSLATWEKGGADSVLATRVQGDVAHNNFKTVFLGLNLQQVVDTDDAIDIVGGSLEFLGVDAGGYVAPQSPVIFHPSVRNRVSGTDTPIKAVVLGGDFNGPVTLYYRIHGTDEWKSVTMTKGSNDGSYLGVIPGKFVTPAAVEYYLGAAGTFDPKIRKVVHVIGVGMPEVTN